ncbi:hypothetical protein, partial [Escherichia coli]|uniref:hypothetical protein n=1 Tax=Escherichia coli TaxID=562 RepID=UPI0022647C8F
LIRTVTSFILTRGMNVPLRNSPGRAGYPVRHFSFFFSICWRVLKKEFSVLNTDLMRPGYGEGR